MKKAFAILLSLTLAASAGTSAVASGEIQSSNFKKDRTKAAIYLLGACQSPTEMDCIAGVGILENSGFGDRVTGGSQVSYQANKQELDFNGNAVLGSESIWEIATTSGTMQYSLRAQLESPKHVWDKANMSRAGALRVFVNGNEDDLSTQLRIQVRTSWLKPLNLAMYAASANWSKESIRGGNLWTFSGSRIKASYYFDNWAEKLAVSAPADGDGTNFTFLIDHAGINGESYYDTTCSDKGFTAEASNGTAAGQPSWNPSTKSLEFMVFAPHTDTQGNLNKGFFKLWVTREYMDCKWPDSGLADSPSFTVSVYNEDGSKQLATTLVAFKKGQFYVEATNFHYSAPTISLKPSKKRQLACLAKNDPSKVKTIRGTKPKCPKGYRPAGF